VGQQALQDALAAVARLHGRHDLAVAPAAALAQLGEGHQLGLPRLRRQRGQGAPQALAQPLRLQKQEADHLELEEAQRRQVVAAPAEAPDRGLVEPLRPLRGQPGVEAGGVESEVVDDEPAELGGHRIDDVARLQGGQQFEQDRPLTARRGGVVLGEHPLEAERHLRHAGAQRGGERLPLGVAGEDRVGRVLPARQADRLHEEAATDALLEAGQHRPLACLVGVERQQHPLRVEPGQEPPPARS
jgi:hypothetical protein